MRTLAYFFLFAVSFGAAWWFRRAQKRVDEILYLLKAQEKLAPLSSLEKFGKYFGWTVLIFQGALIVGFFLLSMFFLGAGVRELWR